MNIDITRVFKFKISLKEVTPEVWRRILVPQYYSFWDLHVAIQDSMGWLDCHLHEFKITNPATGELESIGIPDLDGLDENDMLPGWDLAIADYFSKKNTRADYIYDFGDGWEHAIELEGSPEKKLGKAFPVCTSGKRACPPEDCGGPWGYARFLEIMSDPKHAEHEDMMRWISGSFNPEKFSPRKVKFDDPNERWEIAFRNLG